MFFETLFSLHVILSICPSQYTWSSFVNLRHLNQSKRKRPLRLFWLTPLISFPPFPPFINHFPPTPSGYSVTKSKWNLFKAKNKSLIINFEIILHIVIVWPTWYSWVVKIGVIFWKLQRCALEKAMQKMLWNLGSKGNKVL